MWISLDVLVAALANICEFKVFNLLPWFVHKRYHFTPSCHSILLYLTIPLIIIIIIIRTSQEVHNRIESNWIRIESKLIRNRVELVPNQHPIEIESNLNRIWSNRTSPPGDFLFQFDSSHIIKVWYKIIRHRRCKSNGFELNSNRIEADLK
jgi:hypothetical protein